MRSLAISSALSLALIAGCSSANYKAAAKTNNSLGDVKSELITDKAQLTATVDSLNDLVYKPQPDLRGQYEKFSSSVDALDKAAANSRASAKNMVANREAYLTKWRSDIAAMNDVDLRMRAVERIEATQKRFSDVGLKVVDVDNTLYPLVNKLKALRTYLGSDLTANGIQTVTDRATDAKKEADTVNRKIDDTIVELDKVSDELAPMPATQQTN